MNTSDTSWYVAVVMAELGPLSVQHKPQCGNLHQNFTEYLRTLIHYVSFFVILV
jgi:hypothetical protein